MHAVDAHTGGEPARVIVGGVADVPGKTMFEKMTYLETQADDLRLRMLREPRGYPASNCNLILPSTHPEAAAESTTQERWYSAKAATVTRTKPRLVWVTSSSVNRTVERRCRMTACTDEDSDGCDIDKVCTVKGNWQLVNQVVRRALENITLEHMAAPMPCSLDQLIAVPSTGARLPQAGAAHHDKR